MAEGMQRDTAIDPREPYVPAEQACAALTRQAAAPRVEEQRASADPRRKRGAAAREVGVHGLVRERAERDLAPSRPCRAPAGSSSRSRSSTSMPVSSEIRNPEP